VRLTNFNLSFTSVSNASLAALAGMRALEVG
jgi:hypothetical protein